MSYTRIDAEYTWRGFRAILLENHYIRALFLPELGGKLWSLYDKIADCEVLWHNPRLPPRPAHYGAAYDDWFCGGWDELFPNDAPTMLSGEPYPDHGEWWAMPFDVAVIKTDTHCGIVLRRRGVVTDTSVTKTITLHNNEAQLRIHYQLVNHSYQPLDYLWKLHPALAINSDCRIDMPAQRVIIEDGFRGRIGADVAQFTWPYAGAIDMRQIPPVTAQSCDFYYGLDLQAGWCALTDTRQQRGFGLAFDAELFRSVWVFGAYGGWRGLYTTILEPCTGYPYRLDDAVAQGTASCLASGAQLTTELRVVVYQQTSGVAHISRAGQVTGLNEGRA